MYTIPLNATPIYINCIGTIGAYKHLHGYRTFGRPKLAFLSRFQLIKVSSDVFPTFYKKKSLRSV